MKTYISTLIILFYAMGNMYAASIEGKVNDYQGSPVPFTSVILYNALDSAMTKAELTDDNGNFKLDNLENGNYYIVLSYVGYPEYTGEVFELTSGENKSLGTIAMTAPSNELDEVTVVAKRPMLEMKADKIVFNVEGSINAAGNSALELLKKSPGVVVDNNDNISLMGKSGVQIYIDGKPSPMGTSDLADYLSSLQSDQIDAIEIITNPGAKYEAEGNAGIINIRLKRNENLGYNGSIGANYTQGIKARYNSTLQTNYRKEKYNAFGSYTFYKGEGIENFNLNREQYGLKLYQDNQGNGNWLGHNYRAGLDLYANSKSTFGILLTGNTNDGDWIMNSNMFIGTVGSDVADGYLKANSQKHWTRRNNNLNLNYKFDSGTGTSWNIDADAGRYRTMSNEDLPNTYLAGDGVTVLDQILNASNTPNDIDIYTLKIDYETEALGGALGFGSKASLVETDNTFDFFNVIDGTKVIDPEQSNNFVYQERVFAFYGNYSKKIENWNFQAGLRLEQTHSDGMLTAMNPSDNENVVRNYVDLFPSMSVGFQANAKNSFQLNYSRRLQRPNYQDLNPFRSRIDDLTFELGNPFLNPEYANNIQLSHNYNYRFTTTVGFSHTSDLITRFTDIEGERGSYITYLNLSDQYNYSISISAPISITEKWSSYTSLTGYMTENKADYGDGKTVDISQKTFNIYSQQTLSLPKDWNLELSGWYNSPSLWGGTFEMKSMYSIDFGIQKKILDGNGNLKLSVSDIFRSTQWNGTSQFGELYMHAFGIGDSRNAKLSFTYKFGNQKIKTRKRKTGLEEEESRIKGDKG